MRKRWIVPMAMMMIAAAPLAHSESANETPSQSQSPNRGKADASFIEQALKSGREAVELAKLAAERSRNEQIKQFAEMLVSDHTAVNEQLVLLSQRDGASPAPRDGKNGPASPPAAKPGAAPTSAKAQELAKLTGAQFDQRFLAMIIDSQEKASELYGVEAEQGANPGAKKLATDTLQRIKSYLEQGKSIRGQSTDKDRQ